MDAVYVGYPSFDDLELNDAKIQTFSLTYDNSILEDINLSFKPGEISVLTGQFRLREK
ncbi:hypothetical protein ACTQ42_00570 [Streptococcus alactolyticus]|uniref:Uncharacterized protein n=2 Tax=Streptococcus TaxID=1301 RepID=E8JN79_STREI|nr:MULTISPECIES: hypothetical protein [Streptococcus]MDE2587892.1 hypothetical protein [Lactobacillales bacterium]AGS05445.1 hypothetical protein KE3_0955 [Streptococcus lutetiensis 033]EFW89346.1 hypothetical protein HMPREF0819_0452 [Streptococcus equinus ATCC 9812]MBT0935357.1 hypothetical protein [Streptococcus lutetiensis]MBT0937005.1 hypothetical protein [Streptococcus lutetiensis]